MELVGKKVKLIAMEEEHIEMLRELANDPEFEKMIVGWSYPINKKDQKAWCESVTKNDVNNLHYVIWTEEDGPVGAIGLRRIDWKNGTADGGGMRIAKKEIRTRGLATDAWMTLMRYCFEELRLNRVNGSALIYNAASQKVCERVGFKREGIMRQAVYKNGEFHDVVMYGCLRSDYEELIANNHYWEDAQ